MSPLMIDLSHFKRDIRSKIRLSIFMSRLLHLIYLVIKNYKDDPEKLSKYDTFWKLVSDERFIRSVLNKESRYGSREHDPLIYFKLLHTMKERGYMGLLELAETVWDLTIHHKRIDDRTMFNNIVGLKPFLLDEIELYGKVIYRRTPFIMYIKFYKFLIVEAELSERTETLAKTLIYIGSLTNTDKALGLFARFSLRSLDVEYMMHNQNNGYIHEMLKMFRLYPTVLRMQRLAYRKLRAVKDLEKETLNMISELYVNENELASIVNMDARANVLAMAPSISLSGGLCIVTAFKGELLNPLGAKTGARIKAGDMVIKAYPSYNTVLPHSWYPGEYLFVVFHPFTVPKVGLVVATYPVEILDKIKPKKRNVALLDKFFPRIEEVARAYFMN